MRKICIEEKKCRNNIILIIVYIYGKGIILFCLFLFKRKGFIFKEILNSS